MAAHLLVTARADQGQTPTAVIRRRLTLSWSQARQLIESGRVRLAGA